LSKKVLSILITIWILVVNPVLAHPGNTDSSGGHTCRTNCEQWGLNYGEYHYHDTLPDTSESDYRDGYDRGYEFAYSYTSQCEEEYEWWWEGPQAFGDGYEQGISDGHQEGLLVCFEDSFDEGREQGYSDYINNNEYNEEPDSPFDISSYGKGYAEGWAQAENEDVSEEKESIEAVSYSNNSSTDPIQDESVKEELSSIDEEEMFEDGYSEGYEAATEDYIYDDYERDLNKQELEVYRKGYFSGFIEGGGGTLGQKIYYHFFQKYLFATISIGVTVITGLIWLLVSKRKSRQETNFSSETNKMGEGGMGWLISGIAIISIIAIIINVYTGKSESVNEEHDVNPYSYTSSDHDCDDFPTQKEAQLFFEANGGPEEDPHDLDHDGDGMACDWNP
jgi:hypothetical protein